MKSLFVAAMLLPAVLGAQARSSKIIPIGKEKTPKKDTIVVHVYHTDTLRLTTFVHDTVRVAGERITVTDTTQCSTTYLPIPIPIPLPRTRRVEEAVTTTVTPEPGTFVYGLTGVAAVCLICKMIGK